MVADESCPECGHSLADHVESGWGPHTVCVVKLDDEDEGFYGVCPCVRVGAYFDDLS